MICALIACSLALGQKPLTTPIEPPARHRPAKPAARPAPKKSIPVKKPVPAKKLVPVPAPAPVTWTDARSGSGAPVKDGDLVTVQFLILRQGGQVVADSKKRGMPYTFQLGAKGNDPLLERVVKGMRVGGIRTGTIAAKEAYGPNGAPPVVSPRDVLDVSVVVLRRGDH